MAKAKPKSKKPVAVAHYLAFNHAMIYSREVGPAVHFYANQLGFKLIDEFRHEGMLVYARLRAPSGDSTISIHHIEFGKSIPEYEGVRLYFEVKNLDAFCKTLEAAGVKLDAPPKVMSWGWKHAYLKDPDGHEISLYWAGPLRLQKTKT